MKNWIEVKNDFTPDGALRDIYILNTSRDTWQIFLDLLNKSKYLCSFYKDGEELSRFLNYEEISKLQKEYTILLSIEINQEIIANCHFFSDEEIELDIVPGTIKTEDDYMKLTDLIKLFCSSLKKDAIITHENCQDMIITQIKQKEV